MTDRPRILILGDLERAETGWPRQFAPPGETVHVASWLEGLERLSREHFDVVLSSPADATVLETIRKLLQSRRVLATLPDGVALLNGDCQVRWANPAFEAWCDRSPIGRDLYEALGSSRGNAPRQCPFRAALAATDRKTTTTHLVARDNRHLELQITPLVEPGDAPLLVAIGRDVTAEVRQRQKLDALYKAGRELAALSPDQLAEMSAEERVELLKLNIRRFTHDVLHYNVVEIRLLDRRTGRLEPLLQDGMMPEAANRPMIASTEGQGVTGYVAAIGKSYLCPETRTDPLYIQGAPDARSSLTVPLVSQDQVIGTLNVESPAPQAFGESDRQFLELFGQEIAAALHTLELLSAEKLSTATQSIEAISREVALPVDDILAASMSILERYIGHDAEIADKLRQIVSGARAIKACIQKVGENIAPLQPVATLGKPAPPSLKGLRVLVADNDDRVRRSAHNLLGRWGCIVETARDGHEAITMARLGSYDAVLADIRLPDMAGYEVYRALRNAQPDARVVLMTGYGYDPTHTLVKARQDGLRQVLFKPFRVDQLLDALTGSLDGPTPRGQGSDCGANAPHSTLLTSPTP